MRARPLTVDVAALLATEHERLVTPDGKSGVALTRVVLDGRRLVVKRGALGGDWLTRATGDTVGWPLRAFEAGLLDRVPACIDPTVLAVSLDDDVLTVVMDDVGELLVPEGDEPISVEQHARFIDHMAAFHAAFWGWRDDVGLLPTDRRWRWMAPDRLRAGAGENPPPIVELILDSWDALPARSPTLHAITRRLFDDDAALLRAFDEQPSVFVHGDWKLGNLGSRPDGRTVLVDWSVMGQAPPGWDLAHHLCLNAARIPIAKEAVIELYRAALERHGVDTGGWFDPHVDLCLLGHMALLAWEKGMVGGAELRWWEERAAAAATRLGA